MDNDSPSKVYKQDTNIQNSVALHKIVVEFREPKPN